MVHTDRAGPAAGAAGAALPHRRLLHGRVAAQAAAALVQALFSTLLLR